MKRLRITWVRGLGLAAALVAVIAIARVTLAGRDTPEPTEMAMGVPTARVERGALELSVHTTGELRASMVRQISAPSVGGMLRLVSIAETGTAVKSGDVVMHFDTTEQEYALEVSLSQLAEADQEIVKNRADMETQASQDALTLLTSRFDQRRAELNAISNRALIPANDYAKRQLTLDESKRRLSQVEVDVKSRAETARATLAVSQARRDRLQLAADRARQNIESLSVRAPIDGYVVVRDNRDANGGNNFAGLTVPVYRAGDNVAPGRPIVDVVDISHLEVRAKVNEQERDNVGVGQVATLESDSLAGQRLGAKVLTVSGVVQSNGNSSQPAGPLREFDVTMALDTSTAALRPGTSVRVLLAGAKVDNVLHVPRQAVFEKNGKTIVFVRVGDHFEPRPVTLKHRTETRIALEGVDVGAEVAMVNPDRAVALGSKSGAKAGAGK